MGPSTWPSSTSWRGRQGAWPSLGGRDGGNGPRLGLRPQDQRIPQAELPVLAGKAAEFRGLGSRHAGPHPARLRKGDRGRAAACASTWNPTSTKICSWSFTGGCGSEYGAYPHLGIAIQAYLRDTDRDLADLLDWSRRKGLPVSIRLVKGAYWDYEVLRARQNGWDLPVYRSKAETDAAFERAGRMILRNHDIAYLACGSHNIRSIAAVLTLAREFGVPDDRYEFQVLYGMAEPIRKGLLKAVRPGEALLPLRHAGSRYGLSGAPPPRKQREPGVLAPDVRGRGGCRGAPSGPLGRGEKQQAAVHAGVEGARVAGKAGAFQELPSCRFHEEGGAGAFQEGDRPGASGAGDDVPPPHRRRRPDERGRLPFGKPGRSARGDRFRVPGGEGRGGSCHRGGPKEL